MFPPLLCLVLLFGLVPCFPLGIFPLPVLALKERLYLREQDTGKGPLQELLALRPEDISEDGSVIHVEYAVKMVNGVPQLGPPKSVRSRRTIPIPEQFCPYVRYLREHSGTPYVWTCSGGNPLYGVGSFRRRFYTALKNVGQVRKLSPHCCRHTYVTMLQANGVPMETIAALTGHSDIKTTEGYLHQSADTLAKAVEVLNGKAVS